jgi:hypothetical protein
MMTRLINYKYEALQGKRHRIKRGTIDATSEQDARTKLLDRGLHVCTIKPAPRKHLHGRQLINTLITERPYKQRKYPVGDPRALAEERLKVCQDPRQRKDVERNYASLNKQVTREIADSRVLGLAWTPWRKFYYPEEATHHTQCEQYGSLTCKIFSAWVSYATSDVAMQAGIRKHLCGACFEEMVQKKESGTPCPSA